MIVPVLTVTTQERAPVNQPAGQLATKAGMPICFTKKPVIIPATTTSPRPSENQINGADASRPGDGGNRPRNPARKRADRSMCRMIMTSVMPTAKTAI